jgi:hypothetical protein
VSHFQSPSCPRIAPLLANGSEARHGTVIDGDHPSAKGEHPGRSHGCWRPDGAVGRARNQRKPNNRRIISAARPPRCPFRAGSK